MNWMGNQIYIHILYILSFLCLIIPPFFLDSCFKFRNISPYIWYLQSFWIFPSRSYISLFLMNSVLSNIFVLFFHFSFFRESVLHGYLFLLKRTALKIDHKLCCVIKAVDIWLCYKAIKWSLYKSHCVFPEKPLLSCAWEARTGIGSLTRRRRANGPKNLRFLHSGI